MLQLYCSDRKNAIERLQINGEWCRNPSRVKDHILEYFEKIFAKEDVVKAILSNLPFTKLSAEDSLSLEKEFDKDEILRA